MIISSENEKVHIAGLLAVSMVWWILNRLLLRV